MYQGHHYSYFQRFKSIFYFTKFKTCGFDKKVFNVSNRSHCRNKPEDRVTGYSIHLTNQSRRLDILRDLAAGDSIVLTLSFSLIGTMVHLTGVTLV